VKLVANLLTGVPTKSACLLALQSKYPSCFFYFAFFFCFLPFGFTLPCLFCLAFFASCEAKLLLAFFAKQLLLALRSRQKAIVAEGTKAVASQKRQGVAVQLLPKAPKAATASVLLRKTQKRQGKKEASKAKKR
jgi:hypothetical protein